MRIQDLTGKYAGKDVYVIGTGASMRVFPIGYLDDKITIGLNQAWRYAPMTYSVTVHPELVQEYLIDRKPTPTKWIVKRKPPMEDLTFDDERFYVFQSSEDLGVIETRPEDTLYVGRGIQQTALDLAARMGAANIFLVGVDMDALDGEHHGHNQHVRFHGLPPDEVYREYRRFTARARRKIRELWKVNVFTLSPLLGANAGTEDYVRLCMEHALPKLPPPKDTSTYTRKTTDGKSKPKPKPKPPRRRGG